MNLDLHVLAVHGQPIPLGVALGLARVAGLLDGHEREVCELLRSGERAIAAQEIPSAQRIDALLHAWRREHRLSAAADTRAWLLRRGMGIDDVKRLLVLDAVRERFAHPQDGTIQPEMWSLIDDELPRFLAVQFRLESVLDSVAARLVVANAAHDTPCPHDAAVESRLRQRYGEVVGALANFGIPASGVSALLDIETRYRAYREQMCTPERLAQELDRSFRQHVCVVFGYLRFRRESQALEAAALARDGWDLAAIASANEFRYGLREAFLGDIPDRGVAERLGCHTPGEVFGPHLFEGAHCVFELQARIEPSCDDPRVCQRLSEAVERALVKPKLDSGVRDLYAAYDALGAL